MKNWWRKLSQMKQAVLTVILTFVAIDVTLSFAAAVGYKNSPKDIYIFIAVFFIPFALIVLIKSKATSTRGR